MVTSLADVGGVLAGPQVPANGTAAAEPVPQQEADRLGAQLHDHSAVAPLVRAVGACQDAPATGS